MGTVNKVLSKQYWELLMQVLDKIDHDLTPESQKELYLWVSMSRL